MRKNDGFSLVEVIIAIALTAIIAAIIATVFRVSGNANTVLIKKAANQSDIRYAATYLRERVREADTVKVEENSILALKVDDGSKTKDYYIEDNKHALMEKINSTENILVYNIGSFTAELDTEKKLLSINIKSVEDEKHQGATVQETIVMYILDEQLTTD